MILGTSELAATDEPLETRLRNVERASDAAIVGLEFSTAQIHFLKTSTGKGGHVANLDDTIQMLLSIKKFEMQFTSLAGRVEYKAAGRVKTVTDAFPYLIAA